jgi:hypothetical protein
MLLTLLHSRINADSLYRSSFHTPLSGHQVPVTLVYITISFVVELLNLVSPYGYRAVPAADRPAHLVVVTGCDSGFGREIAVALARDDGYAVLAGCLTLEAVRSVKYEGGDRIFTELLDVTADESVACFAGAVHKLLASNKGLKLHAVINNAGVGSGGAVDWLKLSAFKFDMEVRSIMKKAVPTHQSSTWCLCHHFDR